MAERRVVGPGFHAKVYALVRKVPRGRVTTYGQIATLLGSPRVARQVGWAMAADSGDGPPVPWHRVINAKGGISSRGDVLRAQEQRERLEAEGVHFRENGTVDLDRYRWHFPGHRFPKNPIDPDAFERPTKSRSRSARGRGPA
jgi:methylated-DNA-protein-cysteine methyltransferase-like protein